MTSSLIAKGRKTLSDAGIETAGLDTELLLAHAMGRSRMFLITHPTDHIANDSIERFDHLLDRRRTLEPLAYITGVKEFYSLDFKVNEAVLIPRPDTETVVSSALEIYGQKTGVNVLDMGTGSGVIAITLASLHPDWNITAVDSSSAALDVARENCVKHKMTDSVRFVNSDIFSSVDGVFDLIVSNPPYIADDSPDLDQAVRLFEPSIALYAGVDGLDIIKRIIEDSRDHLNHDGHLIMEIGSRQTAQVTSLMEKNGYTIDRIVKDLAGLDRVLIVRKGN